MGLLKWDESGKRLFETGVSKGVLYLQNSSGAYPEGVAWNGLTSVTEAPSGAEATALYADNTKYLNLMSAEEFGATIEAYTYPDQFAECNGEATVDSVTGLVAGQQSRKTFGLCYRTEIGSDTDGNAHGYKLHLIYGCLASPSQRAYSTINDSPEAITFSWEVKTTPVSIDIEGSTLKPTACLVIDSTKVDKTKLEALEALLYGTDADPEDPESTGTTAQLPLPAIVVSTLKTTTSPVVSG